VLKTLFCNGHSFEGGWCCLNFWLRGRFHSPIIAQKHNVTSVVVHACDDASMRDGEVRFDNKEQLRSNLTDSNNGMNCASWCTHAA
jgi:hypothetical protein